MECPYCKEEILQGAIKCKHCESMLGSNVVYSNQPNVKSRKTAAFLALFLGHLGIHKFYLGSWGWGILYILFFFTFIPMGVALIEAIRYFSINDDEFNYKVSRLNGPLSFLW